jgi:hypothetical protein
VRIVDWLDVDERGVGESVAMIFEKAKDTMPDNENDGPHSVEAQSGATDTFNSDMNEISAKLDAILKLLGGNDASDGD